MQKEILKSNFLKVLTLLIDILLINVGFYFSILIMYEFSPPQNILSTFYEVIPYISISTIILFHVYGLYNILKKSLSDIFYSIGISIVFNLIITICDVYIIKSFSFPRRVIVLCPFIQFILICSWRFLAWYIRRSQHGIKGIALIGNANEYKSISEKIFDCSNELFNINFIDSSQNINNIYGIINNFDEILICESLDENKKSNLISYCTSKNKKIYLIPKLYEILLAKSKIDQFDDIPVFEISNLGLNLEQKILKRSFDLLLSIIGMIITLPIMLIVALCIKIDSKGPVLYLQERVTINNKKFKVIKFRTMVVDAEKKLGPVLALESDPRVTKCGQFIRSLRLDELPQLINVLLGDMSFIGPRPEREFFIEQFKREIPDYDYRHKVKAGITGLAQVQGKYTTSAVDKLRYELMYIKNYSFLLDIKIIFQTIKIVFMKESSQGVSASAVSNKKRSKKQHNVYQEIAVARDSKIDVVNK